MISPSPWVTDSAIGEERCVVENLAMDFDRIGESDSGLQLGGLRRVDR